ncbi:MAG: NAD(P)/FAD-dependent oxidoreductase [Chitinophagales bacterium]
MAKATVVIHDVLIIGSGFSGIGTGIQLKKAGYSFVILERESDLGGTWRDNKYPGIAVDITSFTYSYSFEQNPNWSRVFAPGKELFEYAQHCVDKYNLREHFIFNATVTDAAFDEQKKYWTITLSNKRKHYAKVVISATGALTDPNFPDIKGINHFKGELIHTARWKKEYDLKNKKVAVIGTGATSVQLIPAIAPIVQQLQVYQRTPIWIARKPDAVIPTYLQDVFSLLPFTQNSIRKVTDKITEQVMVTAVVKNKQFPFIIKYLENVCLRNLHKQVKDPVLREKLTPKYGFGCKRPSFSSDYYPTFNRKNVELITDGITEITKDSIITKDGTERKADTLITATGFKVMANNSMVNYKVYGKDKQELSEYWQQNRLQAYHGCSIPGFPNFFMIFGPYSASGLSWFDLIEIQLNHIMRVLNENRKRKTDVVEIKKEANDTYFKYMLENQENTVFFNNNCSGANSYYFDKNGDAPFLRPLSVAESRKYSLTSDLNHYSYS